MFFGVRGKRRFQQGVSRRLLFAQGSCKERPNFVRDMNFRQNLFFSPSGPRDAVLYSVKDRAEYASHCTFARNEEIEKFFAGTTDLRKAVVSEEFKKWFPAFRAIPVEEIGISRRLTSR